MTLTTTATTGGLADDVRVGIYLRSTDDEHRPYSIGAQHTRLTAYIGSQPGWRQAARFTDDASGATTASLACAAACKDRSRGCVCQRH